MTDRRVRKIISGGQTGVDRAALDFAIETGVDFGGFVPRGRLDEVGVIPARYTGLTEAPSEESSVRTSLNVCGSDGTAVFSRGAPRGGTELTAQLAEALNRPLVRIDLNRFSRDEAAAALVRWIGAHRIAVLNVAGPRTSEDPGAYDDALAILRLALSNPK